jgi:predicted esterase
MKWQDQIFDFPLPMHYWLSPTNKKGLAVLLHGFQDHAGSMLKRLGWLERDDLPFQVFASNAPFPVPAWTGTGWKEAYSWYFRDASRGLTLVPPQLTCDRIAKLLQSIGHEHTPKVLIGFSQGGYLAPYLAKATPNVKGIIGLGTGFTNEPYEGLSGLTVHGLHGADDKVIDLQRAQSDHAELLTKGFKGTFHIEPALDHRVDAALEPRVKRLTAEILGV